MPSEGRLWGQGASRQDICCESTRVWRVVTLCVISVQMMAGEDRERWKLPLAKMLHMDWPPAELGRAGTTEAWSLWPLQFPAHSFSSKGSVKKTFGLEMQMVENQLKIWRGRWQGGSGLETHVHSWWIYVDVWQNQYSIVK